MTSEHQAAPAPGNWRRAFRVFGLAILLAGYAGAALIWRGQDRFDRENAELQARGVDLDSPLDSRGASQQIEEQSGKAGLIVEGIREWIVKWTRGRRLAEVLVVVSSAACITLFFLANRRVGTIH